MRIPRAAVCLACLACLAVASCKRRLGERARNPMFRGMDGSATASEAAPLPGSDALASDPNLAAPAEIRVEVEKGKFVLTSRSARDLMRHIHATLENGERDLFTEQVLSELTREEFRARSLDPGLAFDELLRRREDITKLFNRLPMGEHSPNALLKKVDRRIYRVIVTGKAAEGLSWAGFDMALEKGQWKLRWFVGG